MFTPCSVDKFLFATLGATIRVYTVVCINYLLFVVVSFLMRRMHRVHHIWIWLGKMIKYKNTDVKCNGHLRTLLFPPVTVVTARNNYSYEFASFTLVSLFHT